MREIMMEAGFPEDAVEDLLEKAEKLKENIDGAGRRNHGCLSGKKSFG